MKRAALRYYGGKYRLADWITSHFPPHTCYVEPFGGAASVLLQKARSKIEVYSDLDSNIVNFFRVLRDKKQSEELKRLILLTPYAREEHHLAFEVTNNPVEKARRLLIRSFMGIGADSLFRAKSGAAFRNFRSHQDCPPSKEWAAYPDCISQFCRRMQGVLIENKDVYSILEKFDSPQTLVYLDPPYPKSKRIAVGKGRGYTYDMTDNQHIDLHEYVQGIESMVIVSGYNCDLYEKMYKGWIKKQKVHFANGAKKTIECLWLNKNSFEALEKGQMELGLEGGAGAGMEQGHEN